MSRLSQLIQTEYFRILERNEMSKNVKNTAQKLKEAVRAEVKTIMAEATAKSPEIEGKLEVMRQGLIKAGKFTDKADGTMQRTPRLEVRIPAKTVSEFINIPLDELTLFFLNGIRITEGIAPFEYRLGEVCFYAQDSERK